jgi:hypothetical protein
VPKRVRVRHSLTQPLLHRPLVKRVKCQRTRTTHGTTQLTSLFYFTYVFYFLLLLVVGPPSLNKDINQSQVVIHNVRYPFTISPFSVFAVCNTVSTLLTARQDSCSTPCRKCV